jgi:hypothetical protein
MPAATAERDANAGLRQVRHQGRKSGARRVGSSPWRGFASDSAWGAIFFRAQPGP